MNNYEVEIELRYKEEFREVITNFQEPGPDFVPKNFRIPLCYKFEDDRPATAVYDIDLTEEQAMFLTLKLGPHIQIRKQA
jgi:hypothetical protein